MAIDAARVTALIDELNFKTPADKEYMTKVLLDPANENSAVQFVGQRERHSDYTRRTQELSNKEKTLETRVNQEVTQYAQRLADADTQIRKIAKDLEDERISRATADARLLKVKETYQLTDEDIPAVQPSRTTPPSTEPAIDIKAILADFKKDLMAQLAPELAAFPKVASIQREIADRHQELTGKRLTHDEMAELMQQSQAENGPSLMNAWRAKYGIAEIEKTKEREEWSRQDRQKWDDEQKAKQSEEAMRQVRTSHDGEQFKHYSPVFREYKTHDDPGQREFTPSSQTAPTPTVKSPDHVPAVQNTPRLSGAERAAARWITRRQQGVPMGAPDPVSK